MDFTPSNLPIENEYPKLVRDMIPDILLAKGLKCEIKIMDDREYLKFLLKKIVEESNELEYSLKKGNMQEELADVLELIDAVLEFKGWKLTDIQAVQKEKLQKNGGFRKKILMLKKP